MDSNHPPYLLGVFSGTTLWNHVIRLFRPIVLAPSYLGFKQGYFDGIGYHPRGHLGHDHAVVGWCSID